MDSFPLRLAASSFADSFPLRLVASSFVDSFLPVASFVDSACELAVVVVAAVEDRPSWRFHCLGAPNP